jgi:hypothetical protein
VFEVAPGGYDRLPPLKPRELMITYGVRFLHKSIHEDSQQLVSVVDLVRILSNNPDQGGLGFRFVKFIEVGAQCRNNALIL